MRLASRSLTCLAVMLASAGAAAAADAERGRILYETRCHECHAESVHGRSHRVARDFEAVRGWVRRWSANLDLKWTESEVGDVAAFLNGRYYRYACPPADCAVTGSRDGGGPRLALDDPSR